MHDAPLTKANLLRFMQQGWDDFQVFLSRYSRDQLSTLTDPVGWTPKDHIVHLALWEEGIAALLEGQSQREGMGLDETTWTSGEERINATLQQRFQTMTLEEVLDLFRHSHSHLVTVIERLADEDLQRPYRHYLPGSSVEEPVIEWIVGNSFGHYSDHRPWIATIVDEG